MYLSNIISSSVLSVVATSKHRQYLETMRKVPLTSLKWNYFCLQWVRLPSSLSFACLLACLLGIICPEVSPSERPSACQGLYFIKLLRLKTELKVYQR